jgi:hypothetical protein
MFCALSISVQPIIIFTPLYDYRKANKVSGIRMTKLLNPVGHQFTMNIIMLVWSCGSEKNDKKESLIPIQAFKVCPPTDNMI